MVRHGGRFLNGVGVRIIHEYSLMLQRSRVCKECARSEIEVDRVSQPGKTRRQVEYHFFGAPPGQVIQQKGNTGRLFRFRHQLFAILAGRISSFPGDGRACVPGAGHIC